MGNISDMMGGPFVPPPEKVIIPAEEQLVKEMLAHGIVPPKEIYLDGKVHRFCSSGKKGDSGWYICFSDGVPAGQFGDWRTGIIVGFKADIGRELTIVENMANSRRMAEAKALREEEMKRKHELAANTVEKIWVDGMHAEAEHAYLKKKQIYSHGARVTGDGRLMVPLYNAEGKLASIQYISENSDKKYHPGGATSECFWSLGEPSKVIYIAEGFATAATIYEQTGCHTIVAYSASNLVPVTRIIREKFGTMQQIVIVADNDVSGVGLKYADQASAKYGAKVVMPPDVGMDANDYFVNGGNLLALLNPPVDEWLVRAVDFSNVPAPVSWLVRGWLQEKSLMMVHGPSGGGKTFVVLDWCMTMAAGLMEWAGYKVRPSTIVYLAGEGHAGLRGRIAAWRQKTGSDPMNMWVSKSGCDLNTPEGYMKVCEQLRAMKIQPDMIVVDTLHRFLRGDENSSQDAKTMLDACAALMEEFNCSVMLVHHTGVSEEAQHRARGSSAWRGALDIEISIVPAKGDRPIEIIQRKSKDAELSPTLYCELQGVAIDGWFDEDQNPVSSAVISFVDAPAKVDKKDNSVLENMKLFSNAWFEADAELNEKGNPTISRSALASYLEKIGKYKNEDSLKVGLSPSSDTSFIAKLIAAELILPIKVGVKIREFEVIHPEWINQLNTRRTEMLKDKIR